MDREFVFSVIIPVYKVEEYLPETMDSVIRQSIGFEENIQVILVNDGSPDNSGELCRGYQEKYPENVVYVEKENGGVSSARNEGIKYIRGKYVNFLDSDDCWDEDAFERIRDFFDMHYDETDVVAARKEFFDARTGYHHLDYRFEKTVLADLREYTDFIQLDVTGAFIRADAIGEHRFMSRLKYGEDARFINEIIIEKRTLGVCREALHFYRKRKDDSSALQNELRSRSYYFDSPKYFLCALLDMSEARYGKPDKYIQNTVMYDLCWRIRKKGIREYLGKDDYEKYCSVITELLCRIDDDVIRSQRRLSKKLKLFCILKKHRFGGAASAVLKIGKVDSIYG